MSRQGLRLRSPSDGQPFRPFLSWLLFLTWGLMAPLRAKKSRSPKAENVASSKQQGPAVAPRGAQQGPPASKSSSTSDKSFLRTLRHAALYCYVGVVLLALLGLGLKALACFVSERLSSLALDLPLAPPGSGPDSAQGAALRLEGKLVRRGPSKFLLYRMIGNDMPPLQCTGQLYRNTQFTLEQETPELPQCRKIWVLNNVVNETTRALLLDLFLSHGVPLEDVLVRRIEYSKLVEANRTAWSKMVTAQNEARNVMLEHGRAQEGARWILPFDGNQFFTDEAWDALRRAADEHERRGLHYFKVPMFRLYHEQRPTWLASDTLLPSLKDMAPQVWESQIAFRNDSTERYDEGLMYGKDNKLELIDRVCGTAKFQDEKGEQEGPTAIDRKQCGCHREVGNDRKVRPFNVTLGATCGYTVRLWYYPCKGVRTSIIFTNPGYRRKLRAEGHQLLEMEIEAEVESWLKEHDVAKYETLQEAKNLKKKKKKRRRKVKKVKDEAQ